MAKRKLKCIVCGQPIAHSIKLPAGSVRLCTNQECMDEFNFRVNGFIPVVSFSLDDFINHEENGLPLLNPKLIKTIVADHTDYKTSAKIAVEVSDFIWAGETLGQMWHDALLASAATVEELFVKSLKDEQLPLIDMSLLHTKEGKELLEKRLQGE